MTACLCTPSPLLDSLAVEDMPEKNRTEFEIKFAHYYYASFDKKKRGETNFGRSVVQICTSDTPQLEIPHARGSHHTAILEYFNMKE